MCGIAGDLSFQNSPSDSQALERMSWAMRRRGPDGGGMVVRDGTGLAHRRLKIIDLTEAGAQPMHDARLGLTLAFNGCIYNHRELRAELEAKGYRFFSTSDSEVILKGYHAWGLDVAKRLSGMFAFAIAERDSGNDNDNEHDDSDDGCRALPVGGDGRRERRGDVRDGSKGHPAEVQAGDDVDQDAVEPAIGRLDDPAIRG